MARCLHVQHSAGEYHKFESLHLHNQGFFPFHILIFLLVLKVYWLHPEKTQNTRIDLTPPKKQALEMNP